jgi:hypothetical protein
VFRAPSNLLAYNFSSIVFRKFCLCIVREMHDRRKANDSGKIIREATVCSHGSRGKVASFELVGWIGKCRIDGGRALSNTSL